MPMRLPTLLAVILLSAQAGHVTAAHCGTSSAHIHLHSPGVSVEGTLKSVKTEATSSKGKSVNNAGDSLRSYVHGHLSVRNIGINDIKVDIRRYRLVFKNELSSSPYIDSVAHFIIRESILMPNEKISYNVYWVFENSRLDEKHIDELRLIEGK